ncbi:DUF4756 family protein [Pectobacterium atrosepticum]|uniref:DUF4756 family protein n=1 Tax=Pectobacterium atrosepticum TaxID=29471 RepID=UPI000CDD0414|nr:DUF4756 family protein [Pectobacterium atrosepticum]POW26068.1 hypothetical protein PB72LOC_03235 [Pectobacterium atrosepticum]
MRKVKTDNSDLVEYLNSMEALKQYPDIQEYYQEYKRLHIEKATIAKIKKYKSAHTELRRLDKKKTTLLDKFIDELNPVNHASALAAKNLEKVQASHLYRKVLIDKSPEELFALVIKQRTEAALEFQTAVEHSLEQLSAISSDFNTSATKRRKLSI